MSLHPCCFIICWYYLFMRKQISFLTYRIHVWLEHPWPFAAFVGAALLYVAALASGITEEILDKESIVCIDGWLVQRLAAHRTSFGIELSRQRRSLGIGKSLSSSWGWPSLFSGTGIGEQLSPSCCPVWDPNWLSS